MRVLGKIFSVIFYIELAAIIAISLLCFAGVPFGIKNYAVTTGSMVPTIPVGSMAYVNTNIPSNDIKQNDVVAFYTDNTETKACVHRAIAINGADKTFTTKGDANAAKDVAPVPFNDVIGRMDLSIPYVGYVADFVASKGVFIALVILATALLSQVFAKLARKNSPQYGIGRY